MKNGGSFHSFLYVYQRVNQPHLHGQRQSPQGVRVLPKVIEKLPAAVRAGDGRAITPKGLWRLVMRSLEVRRVQKSGKRLHTRWGPIVS